MSGLVTLKTMAKVQPEKTTTCYSHLVQCLRDSMHVYQQTLLVHWGLMGGKFYSMHKLTQKIYEDNLLAEKFCELAKLSESMGDQLTLDLGVERGRVHKKFQWLLKSSLDYKK